MDYEKIGKFITQLRKEHHLTQEQLSEKLYVDRSTISKWETGNYVANPEILYKLSQIYNVSINEILAGERATDENKDMINQIPVEILKDNQKKQKRLKHLLLFTIISITALVILFLLSYFINNYNSIRVYRIYGNSENFYMDDGLLVLSREKAYIKLDEIDGYSDKDYESFRLYYIDSNNKEINLLKRNNNYNKTKILLINIFDKDERFSYNDVKEIIKNLYLEIIFGDNQKEIIHLTLEKDFSNNSFFNKNSTNNIIDKIDNIETEIPKTIKDNFKYDYIENKYYLETNKDDMKIIQNYLTDRKIYNVREIKNEYLYLFEYSIEDSHVRYTVAENENEINSFSYDVKNDKCVIGICDKNIIDYFFNKYIDSNFLK